ncbi:MAG: ribonucleotide reductase subunit alpha [Burkholderiaceae bacterium]
MTISTFDDLLRSACGQPEPQRLLFVFTAAGVPDDATAQERTRFEARQGGTLTPLMCVDKAPEDLASFETLLEESSQFDQAWDIVFVAALAGTDDARPSSLQAEAPLQRMVESIKSGRIDGFIAFDAQGQPVQFS